MEYRFRRLEKIELMKNFKVGNTYSHKEAYVVSFSRSGTNLFASYLNLHPNILSLNSGGGKFISSSGVNDKDKWIFLNGLNYTKKSIEWLVFDKMKPTAITQIIDANEGKLGKFNLIDKNHPFQEQTVAAFIVLIRDFDSINKSIEKRREEFKVYWNGPNPKQINIPELQGAKGIPLKHWGDNINKSDYKCLLDIAKKPGVLTIQLETFILHTDECLELIKNYLGLDYFPSKKEIINKGCICGDKFTIVETDEMLGEVIKYDKPQQFYFCESHNSVLSTPGGCNPYNDFDKSKVDQSKDWSVKTMNKKYNNDVGNVLPFELQNLP